MSESSIRGAPAERLRLTHPSNDSTSLSADRAQLPPIERARSLAFERLVEHAGTEHRRTRPSCYKEPGRWVSAGREESPARTPQTGRREPPRRPASIFQTLSTSGSESSREETVTSVRNGNTGADRRDWEGESETNHDSDTSKTRIKTESEGHESETVTRGEDKESAESDSSRKTETETRIATQSDTGRYVYINWGEQTGSTDYRSGHTPGELGAEGGEFSDSGESANQGERPHGRTARLLILART